MVTSPSQTDRRPSLRTESVSSNAVDFPPKDQTETVKTLMTTQRNKSTIFKIPFGNSVDEHHTRLGHHAKTLWQYNKITDVTIKLHEKLYPCHKTVLSCYSKYFKDLLLDSKKDVQAINMRMPNITLEAFEVLLTYMYTSDLNLTCQNIGEVYTASRILGMDGALVLCKRILTGESKFDVHSVYVYVTAKKQRLRDCAAKALKIMTRRFEQIVGTPEFLDLEFPQVFEYLSQDVLATRSEVIVFLAALKWLSVKFLDREQHATELLGSVRFQMMTLNEVLACYSPPLLPGLLEEKRIRDSLLAATCYVSALSVNEEKRFFRYSCKPRRYLLPRETIILWDPSIFDPDRHALYVKEMAATTIQAAFRGFQARKSIAEDIAEGKIPGPIRRSSLRKNLASLDEFEHPTDEDDDTYVQKVGSESISGSKLSIIQNIKKSVVGFIAGNEDVESNEQFQADQQRVKNKKMKEKEGTSQKRSKKSKEKAASAPKSNVANRKSSSMDTSVDHVIELSRNTEIKKYVSDSAVDISSKAFQQSFLPENVHKTYNSPRRGSDDQENVDLGQNSGSFEEQESNENASDFIIVAGGFRPDKGKDDLEGKEIFLFDTSKEKWKRLESMEKARHHHCLVYMNEELYFIGGCNPEKTKDGEMVPEKSCYKLNLRSRTWIKISNMLHSRMYHGVAVLRGKIYAIGGKDDKDRLLRSVEEYNPSSNKWEELESPLETPTMGVGVCAHQGKVCVAGGIVQDDAENITVIDDVICYDPERKRWSTSIKHLPLPRAFVSLVSFEKCLYMIGGTSQSNKAQEKNLTSVADVLYYDEKGMHWTQTTFLPFPRHFVNTAVIGNALFVLGGLSCYQDTAVDEVVMYHKEAHKWRSSRSLPIPLVGFAATSVPEAVLQLNS